MAKRSVEDVLREIDDFMNECKTTAFSANKIVVPRDEFDDLFDDLKVKLPAEIDRCRKIMRNKEAILMDARKTADEIIARANEQARTMISETAVMQEANRQAYETVEGARIQAGQMIDQARKESDEIKFGAMQYTNEIMSGMRDYMNAALIAEKDNYEKLIGAMSENVQTCELNLAEVQKQIIDYTGDPNSVKTAPRFSAGERKAEASRQRTSMMDKVKQAVGMYEDEEPEVPAKPEKKQGPNVDIPDFVATGEKVVPNDTPVPEKKEANPAATFGQNKPADNNAKADADTKREAEIAAKAQATLNSLAPEKQDVPVIPNNAKSIKNTQQPAAPANKAAAPAKEEDQKKVVKKVIKKRNTSNPVIHTPQTAQETVAKTLEAAKTDSKDKTVYRANGKPMPDNAQMSMEDFIEIETDSVPASSAPTKSLGTIDDFAMPKK